MPAEAIVLIAFPDLIEGMKHIPEQQIPATDEDLFGPEASQKEAIFQFIAFRLGTEWYGIEITRMKEIIPVDRITFLPSTPTHITGIISVRGNIVVVCDPKRLLGIPLTEVTSQSRIALIDTELGVLVDEVTEVVNLPAGQLEQSMATFSMEIAGFIERTCHWQGRLIGILNIHKILGATQP